MKQIVNNKVKNVSISTLSHFKTLCANNDLDDFDIFSSALNMSSNLLADIIIVYGLNEDDVSKSLISHIKGYIKEKKKELVQND